MTTADATTPANLEEYTDKQLRKKCLYYGLQNIPITDESRQMVINKLRECITKQEEKKLALRNRRALASSQKQNSIHHSTNEKPAVEKFNITTKQLSSARIVGASVLQELRKKEKIKIMKDRAAAKESNLLKQKETESSSTPNLTKSPIPIKVIKKRPSLSETFGAFKSRENLALKHKPIETNKPAEKLGIMPDKKVKPDNKNMKNLKLLKPKKSRESVIKLKGGNKSMEVIRVGLEENKALKHNNKSFTVLSNDSSVKENIDIINEKFKNLENRNELIPNELLPNKGPTKNFEVNKNFICNFEDCPENLETSVESDCTSETDNKLEYNLATAVLFPEKENHESEFSCKEDSDFDDDCLDCLSSDDSPTTERYYSIKYKSYNNISE